MCIMLYLSAGRNEEIAHLVKNSSRQVMCSTHQYCCSSRACFLISMTQEKIKWQLTKFAHEMSCSKNHRIIAYSLTSQQLSEVDSHLLWCLSSVKEHLHSKTAGAATDQEPVVEYLYRVNVPNTCKFSSEVRIHNNEPILTMKLFDMMWPQYFDKF